MLSFIYALKWLNLDPLTSFYDAAKRYVVTSKHKHDRTEVLRIEISARENRVANPRENRLQVTCWLTCIFSNIFSRGLYSREYQAGRVNSTWPALRTSSSLNPSTRRHPLHHDDRQWRATQDFAGETGIAAGTRTELGTEGKVQTGSKVRRCKTRALRIAPSRFY